MRYGGFKYSGVCPSDDDKIGFIPINKALRFEPIQRDREINNEGDNKAVIVFSPRRYFFKHVIEQYSERLMFLKFGNFKSVSTINCFSTALMISWWLDGWISRGL